MMSWLIAERVENGGGAPRRAREHVVEQDDGRSPAIGHERRFGETEQSAAVRCCPRDARLRRGRR
jgi:hypothetical protein